MEILESQICPLHFLFFHRLSCATIVLLWFRKLIQRDGHVLVGQLVLPPGVVDQVQDPAVPLHLAVHPGSGQAAPSLHRLPSGDREAAPGRQHPPRNGGAARPPPAANPPAPPAPSGPWAAPEAGAASSARLKAPRAAWGRRRSPAPAASRHQAAPSPGGGRAGSGERSSAGPP